MRIVLLLFGSYLVGSLSPAHALCRVLRGCDLRTLDSGNLGARNAGRVLGLPAGLTVLALDAAKGAVAAAVGLAAQGDLGIAVACGAAAVTGHNWPFYLGFSGGRGAATAAGAALVLLPLEVAVGLVLCVIVLRITRSLYTGGAVAMVVSVSFAVALRGPGLAAASPLLISAPLLLRHVPDVVRHVRDGDRHIP